MLQAQEWSTEEESMSNDNGHESDEDDENEDEDEEEDGEHVTDEGHASMSPNSPLASGPVARVTYEDGLPSCPYLPLALVNRSFLNAARTLLYGRHIHLVDIYQAHLLLRTLSEPQVSVHEDEPDADDEAVRQQQSLSYLVRDIAFAMPGLRSLGRGGGSVIIDIIKLCPRLERLSYSSDLTRSAQKPFELALEGCHAMQVIHLRGGDNPAKDLMWEMRNLAPLLSKWKSLKALQVLWLKHSINGPLMPPPSIKLTRLSLAYPDITDSDLVYLLKGSKGTLQQLDLHKPSIKLTRAGVARVVIEHGATLGSLQLDIRKFWHPNEVTAPPAEAAALSEEGAARCRYLMDGLIGHLKVLSELKLSGNLASAMLFARLPKTITILAFEDNIGLDVSKVVTLLAKKVRVLACAFYYRA